MAPYDVMSPYQIKRYGITVQAMHHTTIRRDIMVLYNVTLWYQIMRYSTTVQIWRYDIMIRHVCTGITYHCGLAWAKGTMYQIGVQICPCKGAVFSRKDGPGHSQRHSMVRCAKMAEQIEKLFGFQTWVGQMKWRQCGLIMATLHSRCGHYIFALWFLLSSYLFSLPNLSRCRLDVCHTCTHGVALVRIQNAGLKCAAHGSLKIQDAKKSPSWHQCTTLSGYIFATKACINNPKKNC